LAEFIEAHDKATAGDSTETGGYNIHKSSQNFFWHSYWLYLMEDAIRDFGGEYECFTIPYWDVTHDAKAWDEMDTPTAADLPIYNSNLGGEGDIDDDYCVQDELWNRDAYTTDFLCADDETSGSCCLKRFHIESVNSTLFRGKDFADPVFVDKSFHGFGAFQKQIKRMHGDIHRFVGSISHNPGTHFSPDAGEAVCDPLFPLFHSFLEYIRLLHTDCYQFDLIPNDQLQDYQPWSYEYIDTTLDYTMDFSCLCDDTDGEHKRYCSDHAITARLMYDMSPNSMWGIVYELGDFWDDNEPLSRLCASNLNESWWKMTEHDEEETDAAEHNGVRYFMSNVTARRLTTETTIGVIVVMVIGMAVIALLRRCLLRMRGERKMPFLVEADIGGDHGVYGAI